MSIPVWNSRKCIVCGKYHPQWQMVNVSLDTGRVRQFNLGFVCRNKNCNNEAAIQKALEKGQEQ